MAAVDAAIPPSGTGVDGVDGVVVYFSVGRRRGDSVAKLETALFRRDASGDEVKDLFRSAAEAGPRDIVKLWDSDGRLLNICPRLAGNTPDTRYSLEVVASHCNGMLLDELGVDLRTLEDRVAQLERRLRGEVDELPSSVMDLKRQVDHFREKLETTEHLSWLGFHNDFPESLTTVAASRRLQYRRKSSTEKKRVREKFFSICDLAVSEETRQAIRRPSFDSCQWEDEEVLVLLQQMFVDLDLPARFGIDLVVLRNFLAEVYDHYNEVPFHNFRHCFCVAQMMYAMVWCVDLPGKIGHQETLILLTACICHDLDHPGYNNIYQINAGTELALRYNDISPLENHHCSVAFRLLARPECNFLSALPRADFRAVREGIIRCVLATDMARHNEILEQFCEVAADFDYRNRAHVNLLEMVLIKVADISNEARPMDVAEPWLDRLLQEFFKQSDAEKLEGLPVTPFMDRDKITKPSSQVGFIGLVLLPLFEALGELFSELQELIVVPVREALEHYRRLHDAERMHRKSVAGEVAGLDGAHLAKALSVASRRSPDESEDVVSSEEGGVDEDEDDDDEGPGTEVEHSEKTLTFKISTDAGRRSVPGSRKGSRDTELRVSRVASPASDSDDASAEPRSHSEELRRALEEPARDRSSRLKDASKLSSLEEGKEVTDVRRPGKKVRVREPPDDADADTDACAPRDAADDRLTREEVDELERLKEEAKAIENLQRSLGGLRPPIDEPPSVGVATDNVDAAAAAASPDKKKSLSLLRRFRHLAERLPFGANPGDAGSGSVSENSTPKRSRPTLEPRAATLPKPRRRWRALIGRGVATPEAEAGASRLSGSLDSALDVEKENNNRRKPARWMSSLAASLRPRK